MRRNREALTRPLAAAVLAVLALTATGCGNNGDETAAKSISASIMKGQGADNQAMAMKKGDANCVGKELVDRIGTDNLQKYGLLDKDMKVKSKVTGVKMSEQDANDAADVFFDCTDVMAQMRDATAQTGDPKVKACMDQALTKDAVHKMFVGIFRGDQKAAQAISASLMKCATQGGSAG